MGPWLCSPKALRQPKSRPLGSPRQSGGSPMPLTVHQFPCLSDNYGFLAHDEATGKTACIDTPEVGPILAALKAKGWTLDFILNTHWPPDHAGGNAEIVQATGATVIGPAEVTKLTPIDREVRGGD